MVISLLPNLFQLGMWLPGHFTRNETQKREREGPEKENTEVDGVNLGQLTRTREHSRHRASQPQQGNVWTHVAYFLMYFVYYEGSLSVLLNEQ